MADFDLYWNPANPYSTALDQQVLYKLREDLSYIVAATLPNYADHYTITGLASNRVYDFRISCDCGDTTNYTSVTSFVAFSCPVPNTTRTDDDLVYSFTPAAVD